MNVISNTTVISNFAAIDKVDLLRQLYGTLYIPSEVHTEIRLGMEVAFGVVLIYNKLYYYEK